MSKFLAAVAVAVLSGAAYATTPDETAPIEWPSFQPRTVQADDEAWTVQVRAFPVSLRVGAVELERLPESASRSLVRTYQHLTAGEYDAFVDQAIDPEQAQRFADHIREKSDEDRQAFNEKILDKRLVGEVRVGQTVLVVWSQTEDEGEKLTVQSFIETDAGYRMVAVPYYLLNEIEGLKRAMVVAGLITQGELTLDGAQE